MSSGKVGVKIVNLTDPVEPRMVLTTAGNVPRVGDWLEGDVERMEGQAIIRYQQRRVRRVEWTADLHHAIVFVG